MGLSGPDTGFSSVQARGPRCLGTGEASCPRAQGAGHPVMLLRTAHLSPACTAGPSARGWGGPAAPSTAVCLCRGTEDQGDWDPEGLSEKLWNHVPPTAEAHVPQQPLWPALLLTPGSWLSCGDTCPWGHPDKKCLSSWPELAAL